jgi:phage baseplate assembly protein W
MGLDNEYLRVNLFKKNSAFYNGLEDESKPNFYDLDHDVFKVGEVTDEDAISVSIQNILSTRLGEVIFESSLGSPLKTATFQNFTEADAEIFLDGLIESISNIETRIEVLRSRTSVQIYTNDNTMDISLAFVILDTNTIGFFERQVTL